MALIVYAIAEGRFDQVTVVNLERGDADPALVVNDAVLGKLIEAGGQVLLFDAGRGVPIRMTQLKVSMGKIDALFLTHYHSDHTEGLPDIWLTGWLPPPFGQRKAALHIIGPTGARALTGGLEQAYAADIKIREADEKLPPAGIALEIKKPPNNNSWPDRRKARRDTFDLRPTCV